MTNQDAQECLTLYINSVKAVYGKISKQLKDVTITVSNNTTYNCNYKTKQLQIPATASVFDVFCQLEHLRVSFVDGTGNVFSGLAENFSSEMKKGLCFEKTLTLQCARNLYSKATGNNISDHTFCESENITMQFGAVLGLSVQTLCLLREKINKGREQIKKLFSNLNSKISYNSFENNCDLLHTLNEMAKNPYGSTTKDADMLRKFINDTLFQTLEVGFLNKKLTEKELTKRFDNFNSYNSEFLKPDLKNKLNILIETHKNK